MSWQPTPRLWYKKVASDGGFRMMQQPTDRELLVRIDERTQRNTKDIVSLKEDVNSLAQEQQSVRKAMTDSYNTRTEYFDSRLRELGTLFADKGDVDLLSKVLWGAVALILAWVVIALLTRAFSTPFVAAADALGRLVG